MTIAEWQKEAHKTATKVGWHEDGDGDPIKWIAWLCLVHSEVSEAVECIRNHDLALRYAADGKPEGLGSELADIVLRVLDDAETFGIDLEAAIVEKNSYNRRRSHKHGGKAL